MLRILIILLGLTICANAQSQAQFNLQPGQAAGLEGPDELFGVWGGAKQCAAFRADKYENPGLYPYEISDEWIRRGSLYCYLRWLGEDSGAEGLVVYAFAQCGEDTLRDFQLKLSLQRDRLRITWSPDFTTSELQVCSSE